MKRSLWSALACLALLAAASPSPAAEAPRVKVYTSLGDFVIELDPDRAPLTVASFLAYVREGHYTGTIFHRVIGNFLVQGGGYGPDYKLKPTHDPIPNESGNGLQNVRGSVGLARATGPHTGDAQFFVNVADNPDLNPLPTRWGYAVFGHVVEGMDVVDKICLVATGSAGPFKKDAPVKPILIQKVDLLGAPPAAPSPAAPPPAAPPPAAPSPAAPSPGAPSPGAAAAGAQAPPPPPAGAPPPPGSP